MVGVPAPSIFAPILFSSAARSDDFGFAGSVLQNGFAFGQRGGHEQVFRAGDGDLVEDDFCAAQAVGGGFDVAVFLPDFCAENVPGL